MKKLMSLVALLILSVGTIFSHFDTGQQLQVVAHSGLTMRLLPNANSEALKVIPFGEKVKIVTEEMDTMVYQKIDWVSGNWVLISHEGDMGYVFDGFLSDLPLPTLDFELNPDDLNLFYTLDSWTEYQFNKKSQTDTITSQTGTIKTIDYLEKGIKMTKVFADHYQKIDLEMEGVRLMDAYHLLQNMLMRKSQRKAFIDNTIYVNDKEGNLERINIKLENPITIKKRAGGKIQIRVLSSTDRC